MQGFFAIDMPATRFLRNTLLFSLLGLVPPLALFVLLTPGYGAMLLGGGMPLSRFVRQVLTNGLPVVVAVNYLGFFLYAWTTARTSPDRFPAFILVIDLFARLSIFVLLHVLIYTLSADWFGSFGGSRITALKVVAPTLSRSALFENLSGVYLYATIVSAIPLYAAAFGRSRRLRGFGIPGSRQTMVYLAAVAWFALTVAVLAALCMVVSWLQGR